MGADGPRAGEQKHLVPEELKSDVAKLNKRIQSMNRFLLDPRSKFMQIWDFFTLFALFFTLFITPLEAREHRAQRCLLLLKPHQLATRWLFCRSR